MATNASNHAAREERTGDQAASPSLPTSVEACRELATTHYENFHVLSSLVPRRYRNDLAVLYSFCRAADDAADERESTQAAQDELESLREVLNRLGDARTSDAGARLSSIAADRPFASFVPAWEHLIRTRSLPVDPFHHLLDAFVQDQRKTRYDDWEELLGYCRGSANPVGRLVLLVTEHGMRDDLEVMFNFSDATCTALQLTNFWQDVSRDLVDRDRIYIPRAVLEQFGISEDELREMVATRRADERFRRMERHLVEFTRPFFDEGRRLWPLVRRDVRPMIQLFTAGGEAILKGIERQGFDVLRNRPRLGTIGKASLYCRAWVGARTGVTLF